MASSIDILFEESPESPGKKARTPRIDYDFERLVLGCAIGCLVRDMPMSDADFVRLHLALSRLGAEHKNE